METPEAGAHFGGHPEAAAPPGDVPKQAGVGVGVGRWTWALSQQETFGLKSHKNESMEKTQASFYSPRFSQSPNSHFRIQQRLGTLRPFPPEV